MIDYCRSCKSESLEPILKLGNFYLSDFVEKSQEEKPNSYPLNLLLCKDCFLVQQDNTTPPEELYNNHYGYKSGINDTIRNNLSEIVKEASSIIKLKTDDIVVDIGANDGTLLDNYSDKIVKVGYEPVAKFVQEAIFKRKASPYFIYFADFFQSHYFKNRFDDKKAKIITVISMFYDLDDPNQFLEEIREILDEKGILVIQQNYLAGMLTQNAFDNIVHEHLEYYSLKSLENLLAKFDLEVFDVKLNDINGGSFRTLIAQTGTQKVFDSVEGLRQTEKLLKLDDPGTYRKFATRVEDNAANVYAFVKKVADEGKTVYLYGASTRGNTLLQYYNLDNNLIKAAVERNPDKFGKKIASVDIPIISEAQARKERPDYMFVLPWFHKDEFIRREADYLKSGGVFIIPLPELQIIGGDSLESEKV